MTGVFITFEGIDGSGKTTQAAILADHLRERGHGVVLTREPGGTATGKKIRELLLFPETPLSPNAELLLFLADREQHVKEIIRPALDEGKIVISDRHADSTIAYQIYGRENSSRLAALVKDHLLFEHPTPDLTFFLDITPDKVQTRRNNRGETDLFEKMGRDFHQKVYSGFCWLAASNPKRIYPVNGAQPLEAISQEILEISVKNLTWNR